MSLNVHDLTVHRGGLPVLSNVSFTLDPGKAFVLRGPNGAGKTTLLRTLAGLQEPLAGTIKGAQDQIAYAGHSDGLKSMLTVSENLSFWAQVFGNRSIAPALDAFDLRPLERKLAGALSAGQKRRLGLARLLVTGRPIWVLDEPTVSLDAEVTARFAKTVETHLETGGSAIIATHIDLGLSNAQVLDVAQFRAAAEEQAASDEAFL